MGVRITPTRYALGNGPVAAASCGTVVGGRDLMRTEITNGVAHGQGGAHGIDGRVHPL